MGTVYRPSDRVTIKIADLTFKIAPLSYASKMEVQSLLIKDAGQAVDNIAATTKKLIELCVKDVDGLFYTDGEKFKLDFDEGRVTDESLDCLLNIEESESLTVSLLQLIKGIPKEIVDPVTGEKLEGVEIVPQKGAKKKK